MGAISKERMMSVRRKAVVFILQAPGVFLST